MDTADRLPGEMALELRRLLAVARAAARSGQFAAASESAAEVLQRSRELACRDEEAAALNILGGVAFESGRVDEAERHYTQALGAAREASDDMVTTRVRNNLASIRHLRGDVEGARRLYHEVLESYRRRGDHRGQAETLHNLSLTYREARDVGGAARYARMALDHALASADPGLLCLVMTGEAECELQRGRPAKARTLIEYCGDLAEFANDAVRRADVRRVRALVAAAEQDVAAAVTEGEAARGAARACGARLIEADCLAAMADVLARDGRSDEAAARAAEARQLYEAMGATARLSSREAVAAAGA